YKKPDFLSLLESVCPTRIPVASRDEKGFELMVGLKIKQKAQKIAGSLMSETAYMLTSVTDFVENTRDVFPEGLPTSYVFVATLRLNPPTIKEAFDLWRILSRSGIVQVAVTLDGKQKAVTFTTNSIKADLQKVTFRNSGLQKLFNEEWHQLKLLVMAKKVTLFLDDVQIQITSLIYSVKQYLY
uniref:Si:dkey-225n22.4 n=1 Tax=Latimeria chalumnae TaxID=7897 RepID=H2ZXA4_LATCH